MQLPIGDRPMQSGFEPVLVHWSTSPLEAAAPSANLHGPSILSMTRKLVLVMLTPAPGAVSLSIVLGRGRRPSQLRTAAISPPGPLQHRLNPGQSGVGCETVEGCRAACMCSPEMASWPSGTDGLLRAPRCACASTLWAPVITLLGSFWKEKAKIKAKIGWHGGVESKRRGWVGVNSCFATETRDAFPCCWMRLKMVGALSIGPRRTAAAEVKGCSGGGGGGSYLVFASTATGSDAPLLEALSAACIPCGVGGNSLVGDRSKGCQSPCEDRIYIAPRVLVSW